MVDIKRLGEHVGENVSVRGWVETTRGHGKVAFLVVRDGTGTVQGVVVRDQVDDTTWALHQALTRESLISVEGVVKEDSRAPGGFELGITGLTLHAPAAEYPIQPKEHGVDFLLDQRHLWLRSSLQRAGLRVRAEVAQAINDFLYNRDFVRIDTPILTGAIGEHAGTLFSTDYFGDTAYLAQTGQLYVEAACPAFGKVYCFGPTFRAENSNTRRHLAEFWMVEPEIAFADLADDVQLAEDFLKSIYRDLLDRRGDDMAFFDQHVQKGVVARLEKLVDSEFTRMDYTEAVSKLEKSGQKFDFQVKWGVDLQSEHEKWLTEHVGGPVAVVNYPKDIKAFYMRVNDDDRTVAAMDVLAPGIGEIIGGSQREERRDVLESRMTEAEISLDEYSWYLDLRSYGTVPHSGFGLGFERTVQFITGVANIRDVIPFPRTPKSAEF